MSRSGPSNKMLPEFKGLFLKSAGKPQESHSNFAGINKIYVTETFEEIAPISKIVRKQDVQLTYETFLLKHQQATESKDDDADMLFLKSLHGSF